jgi:hypothetical protein
MGPSVGVAPDHLYSIAAGLSGEIFRRPERAGPDGNSSTPHSVSAPISASYAPGGADDGSLISSFCVRPVNTGNAPSVAVICASSAKDAAEAEIKMTAAAANTIFPESIFVSPHSPKRRFIKIPMKTQDAARLYFFTFTARSRI